MLGMATKIYRHSAFLGSGICPAPHCSDPKALKSD